MLKHYGAVISVIVSGLLTAPAHADESSGDAAPVPKWGVRTLAGHTFLFPVTYAGPFNATYFGIAQGPNLQLGLFAATRLNLRPVPGVAGASGSSGTPMADYAELTLRYIW